jgi:hypothetical protein
MLLKWKQIPLRSTRPYWSRPQDFNAWRIKIAMESGGVSMTSNCCLARSKSSPPIKSPFTFFSLGHPPAFCTAIGEIVRKLRGNFSPFAFVPFCGHPPAPSVGSVSFCKIRVHPCPSVVSSLGLRGFTPPASAPHPRFVRPPESSRSPPRCRPLGAGLVEISSSARFRWCSRG